MDISDCDSDSDSDTATATATQRQHDVHRYEPRRVRNADGWQARTHKTWHIQHGCFWHVEGKWCRRHRPAIQDRAYDFGRRGRRADHERSQSSEAPCTTVTCLRALDYIPYTHTVIDSTAAAMCSHMLACRNTYPQFPQFFFFHYHIHEGCWRKDQGFLTLVTRRLRMWTRK
jgi:hypothetical protein